MLRHEPPAAGGKRHQGRRRALAGHDAVRLEPAQADQAGQRQPHVGAAAARIEKNDPAAAAGDFEHAADEIGLFVGQVAVNGQFPIRDGRARPPGAERSGNCRDRVSRRRSGRHCRSLRLSKVEGPRHGRTSRPFARHAFTCVLTRLQATGALAQWTFTALARLQRSAPHRLSDGLPTYHQERNLPCDRYWRL